MSAAVDRVSVMIDREPIIINRLPINEELKQLDWDNEVWPKFNNYVKYVAKVIAQRSASSTNSDPEELYQEGTLLMWQCYQKYSFRPLSEFGKLFKTSVWHLLNKKSQPSNTLFESEEVLEATADGSLSVEDDTESRVDFEVKFNQVIALLKGQPLAEGLFREFVSPSYRTYEECVKDFKTKERIKAEGGKVRSGSTLEVKPIHIQRSLDLSRELYSENMKAVQKAVYVVYSKDYAIKNYFPQLESTSEIQEVS